jgi:hypothetical protein
MTFVQVKLDFCTMALETLLEEKLGLGLCAT